MRERRKAVDVRAVARFILRSTHRLVVTLIGFVLVGVGLAGLVLPVLPGWVLIIAGFAVLSREYYWAHSCLTFCRRHAARSGARLRTAAVTRRRRNAGDEKGREIVLDPSGEVVIDLRRVSEEPGVTTDSARRASG